ncbi:hypothetical protein [Bacillus sp. USDA818B3_A]|uniref:hypothetical protein n=1 Tax=Bacillus sp. USDA818B3_A TaxID=2698834 RepID=UPI00137029C3|nr:hypothetical protein [Bacillus sp. USDA818B3_A]
MTFNEVMALIMPSFIVLLFYTKLINKSLTIFEGICHLALFMLSINCLCYAILTIAKTEVILFTTIFTMKYCLLAVCMGLVIAFFYRLIELNLKIKLRVESRNEKEKA